jgi:hypothetical protein
MLNSSSCIGKETDENIDEKIFTQQTAVSHGREFLSESDKNMR